MPACADWAATLHKPVYLGLNQWPASIVLRLPLPKFSHIKLNTKLMTINYYILADFSLKHFSFYMQRTSPCYAKVDALKKGIKVLLLVNIIVFISNSIF